MCFNTLVFYLARMLRLQTREGKHNIGLREVLHFPFRFIWKEAELLHTALIFNCLVCPFPPNTVADTFAYLFVVNSNTILFTRAALVSVPAIQLAKIIH